MLSCEADAAEDDVHVSHVLSITLAETLGTGSIVSTFMQRAQPPDVCALCYSTRHRGLSWETELSSPANDEPVVSTEYDKKAIGCCTAVNNYAHAIESYAT